MDANGGSDPARLTFCEGECANLLLVLTETKSFTLITLAAAAAVRISM